MNQVIQLVGDVGELRQDGEVLVGVACREVQRGEAALGDGAVETAVLAHSVVVTTQALSGVKY